MRTEVKVCNATRERGLIEGLGKYSMIAGRIKGLLKVYDHKFKVRSLHGLVLHQAHLACTDVSMDYREYCL